MKFAVISDTHIVVPGSFPDGIWWNKTVYSLAEKRYSSIVRSIKARRPDFVILCGDITGDGKKSSFSLARVLMDEIGCNWFAVVGNHDVNRPDLWNEFSNLYSLPPGINYYSRDIRCDCSIFHFIFLDSCRYLWRDGVIRPYLEYEAYMNGDILKFGIDDVQLSWIEEKMKANKDKKIILVTHTPIYYKDRVMIGTLPKGSENFNDYYPLNKLNPEMEDKSLRRLKSIIDKYKASIKAVFSGHTHINEVICRSGIPFCTTGSLREWPFEFRIAELRNRQIYVTTHSLDDLSLHRASYEKWRNNEWIKGEKKDREFVIKI